MNYVQIVPEDDSLYQFITITLQIGDTAKRVMLELRYEEETDRWYMSLTDVQTKECYFASIPVVASYSLPPNNLWEPFRNRGIGNLWCVPKNDNPSTEDPSKDNLNEFALVWGDGIE